jgi:hypothetical protein
MSRQFGLALHVVAMVAVIVGLDLALFRDRLLERPIVNIGIVVAFAAFYPRFVGRRSSPLTSPTAHKRAPAWSGVAAGAHFSAEQQ